VTSGEALPPYLYAQGPPRRDEQSGGWLVGDYATALRLLSDDRLYMDHRHFPPGRERSELREGPVNAAGLIAAMPARHRALRNLIRSRFTPAAARRLRPAITAVVDDLIDAVLATGSDTVELVSAISRPLSTRLMYDLIGLDDPFDAVMDVVWRWMDEEYHVVPNIAALVDQEPHWQWWQRVLRERRATTGAGRPGILADLLDEQGRGYDVDGEPLSDVDIIGTLAILMSAGSATVAAALPSAVVLAGNSGDLSALAQPPLATRAAAETLRLESPFAFLARQAQADTTLSGCPVRAGDPLTINVVAAQRDPQRWTDPDAFDLQRPATRAGLLAFGRGAHRCIGEHLAYAELEIGLSRLVSRLPGLRILNVADRQFPAMVTHIPSVVCAFDRAGAAASGAGQSATIG
jgi:cytochrome P450